MNNEEKLIELADLIFPDITETIADLEKRYPKRDLEEGAEVTRFAPSPTGFLHIGGLFGSLIDMKVANQSKGKFILRIEDTDRKREVENGVIELITQMRAFNIINDEGLVSETEALGEYGPYKQSEREYIYKVCAKELIKKGRVYPCFCTAEDLDKLRESQEKAKQIPGYYGQYARCRNYSVDEAIERIKNNKEYILRFRSLGSHLRKVKINDIIRGKIEMAQNDQDIVVIKSDGLPTYHFAHAVDDHFMRVTTAVRGEEWIPSSALHMELFEALGFEQVKYAHTPTIMKNDNGSKRKLSKRKDPESAVSFFIEEGYPADSVIEYLLTIINSDYELWRKANKTANWRDFEVKLNKLNSSGALFDMIKLTDVSKEVISRLSSTELLELVLEWAKIYDTNLYNLLNEDLEYTKKVFAIERDNATKIRKDFAKYKDILPNTFYMYNRLYREDINSGFNFDSSKLDINSVKEILEGYIGIHSDSLSKEDWFNKVKEMAEKLGYCTNMKEYKQNPDDFKGSIADVTGVIRVALTNRQNTPDIYAIMQVLGEKETIDRLKNALSMKGE
ncbi:MAG: glutamate--tRNA ligase [Clostridia bacterium]|nr:glutamate--tRNA ligase [Clostridia bacterium]